MSTVYIIGNGFDLNLGLKTSYKDFVNSSIFMNEVDAGNKLFDYLHGAHQEPNWIDIEKELEKYSKNNGNDSQGFLRDYKELCKKLKEYIKSINVSSMNVNSEAYKLFTSKYFDDPVTIINFNYTKSVSHILESHGYDHVDEWIMHVHGSAEIDDIIFGVDDGARIDEEHTFLYKSSSSIYNGKGCINALKEFDTLHIFGHSLGESDHMYLDFFYSLSLYNTGHDKEINIYHYGEEDKHKIYKQLHKLTGNGVAKLKNNTKLRVFDLKR